MLKVLNSRSVAAHKQIYMSARRKSLSPLALFALLRTVTARFHATVTLLGVTELTEARVTGSTGNTVTQEPTVSNTPLKPLKTLR